MTVPGATHFYKYKAPPDNLEWLRDTIVRHQLYFPLPRELNDPAEARPILNISADESEQFLYRQWCKENPSASNGDAEQALEDIREGIALVGPDKFYGRMIDGLHTKCARRRIFSLSKRWDNMSMWAKYAADHRGYCLEFANAGLFAAEFAREVEYVKTESAPQLAMEGIRLTDPVGRNRGGTGAASAWNAKEFDSREYLVRRGERFQAHVCDTDRHR
jgi:hypothetical protein